jgi:hypothetical protein
MFVSGSLVVARVTSLRMAGKLRGMTSSRPYVEPTPVVPQRESLASFSSPFCPLSYYGRIEQIFAHFGNFHSPLLWHENAINYNERVCSVYNATPC